MPDGPAVEVAPGLGLWFPPEVPMVAKNPPYRAEINVQIIDGKLAAKEVRISREDGGPVTLAAMQTVPVAAVTRFASQFLERGTAQRRIAARLHPAEVRYVREHGPGDARALQLVALAYRVGLLRGDPPTQTVEVTFDVPRSTAGRWVAAARAAGHLGASEGPGKAGG